MNHLSLDPFEIFVNVDASDKNDIAIYDTFLHFANNNQN